MLANAVECVTMAEFSRDIPGRRLLRKTRLIGMIAYGREEVKRCGKN
jgi:hypothetical protein